jgi:hypothetical protein
VVGWTRWKVLRRLKCANVPYLPKTRSSLNLNDGSYILRFTIIFSPFYSIRHALRKRSVLQAEILALRYQLLVLH